MLLQPRRVSLAWKELNSTQLVNSSTMKMVSGPNGRIRDFTTAPKVNLIRLTMA